MKSNKEKDFNIDNNINNNINNNIDLNNEISQNEEEPHAEKKHIPLFSKILLVIAAFCAVLYILFLNIPSLCDFFNKYISPIVRGILSYITTWIPFSLAEMLIILIPVIIVLQLIALKFVLGGGAE